MTTKELSTLFSRIEREVIGGDAIIRPRSVNPKPSTDKRVIRNKLKETQRQKLSTLRVEYGVKEEI